MSNVRFQSQSGKMRASASQNSLREIGSHGNVKSRSQDIIIPSVSMGDFDDGISPRSLDSRSLAASIDTSLNPAPPRGVGGIKIRNRTPNRLQALPNSGMSPVSRQGDNMLVRIGPYNDEKPLTRLDILEAHLPRNMRKEKRGRKADRKALLQIPGDGTGQQDIIFNILRGDKGIPSSVPHATAGIYALQQGSYSDESAAPPTNLNASMSLWSNSLESHMPLHFPSGAISLEGPEEAERILRSTIRPLNDLPQYSRMQYKRKTLWGDEMNDSIVKREERIKEELREQERLRTKRLEEQLQEEERLTKLKVKVINTLFNKHVHFKDARIAALYEKLKELKTNGVDIQRLAKHLDIDKVNSHILSRLERVGDGDGGDATASVGSSSGLHSRASKGTGKRKSGEGGGGRTAGGAGGGGGGSVGVDSADDDDATGSVLSSHKGSYDSDGSGDSSSALGSFKSSLSGVTRSRASAQNKKDRTIKKKKRKANTKGSIDDVLVYRTKDFVKPDAINDNAGDSEAELDDMYANLIHKLDDLTKTSMRKKLKNLEQFLNTHTARKMIDCWNFIENRFRNSTYSKTFLELDSSGLTHPVKYPALHMSTLTLLLCSSRVKIGHKELRDLYDQMGFSDQDHQQVFHSRQVAALNVVLGNSGDQDTPQYLQYRQELLELTLGVEEPLVSMQELVKVVFPADEEERQALFKTIYDNRQKEADAVLAEKRRKEMLKDQAETRRKRLVDDFEGSLEGLNILDFKDGMLTPDKLNDFIAMLDRCQKFIAKQREDALAAIPPDLLSFIGIEAFPPSIQEKVNERKMQALARYQQKTGTAPIPPGINPLLVRRAAPAPVTTEGKPAAGVNDASSSAVSATAVGTAAAPSANGSGTANSEAAPQTQAAAAAQPYTMEGESGLSASSAVTATSARAKLEGEIDDSASVTSVASVGDSSVVSLDGSISSAVPGSGTAPTPTPASTQPREEAAALSPLGTPGTSPVVSPRRRGMTAFTSAASVTSSVAKAKRRKKKMDKDKEKEKPKPKRVPFLNFHWSLTRVPLCGPPNIVSLMRETVAFGKGLQGMSYRDAVSVLQYLAATKMGSLFRCYRKRWRYTAARSKWRKNFHEHCKRNFTAWAQLTNHNISTRRYCWRKLVGWRYFTRRTRQRRENFRIGFWPFYVWRRYACASATAKEKTRFLVGRVMPTLLTLRTFRAWKRYTKVESKFHRTSDGYKKSMLEKRYVDLFRWLHVWARKRHRIRRAWNRRGRAMLGLYKLNIVQVPIQLWYFYRHYHHLAQKRVSLHHHTFRHALELDIHYHIKTSNAEKRLALRVAENKRRQDKLRRVSKVQLKDTLKKRARAKKDAKRGSVSALRRSSKARSSVDGNMSDSSNMSDTEKQEKEAQDLLALGPFPDFTEQVKKLFPTRKLRWKMTKEDKSELYDADPVEEGDDEFIPALLLSIYQEANIANLPAPDSFPRSDEFKKIVMAKAEEVYDSYLTRDLWNLFEAAMRFHRFGRRAFANLRHFALTRRRWKAFVRKRHMKLLAICWKEMRHNADHAGRRASMMHASEAEQLSNAVRSQQVMKMVRLRRTTMEVNAAYGRSWGDNIMDEENANKQMKSLNLIDPDDEAYLEAERQRVAEKQAAQKRRLKEIESAFKPPDLLEWDREDRDNELNIAERMVAYGKRTTVEAAKRVVQADEETEEYRARAGKLEGMVGEVLETETSVTDRALVRQKEYVSNFRIHAADLLLGTLVRIYADVQLCMLKEESKVYFRALRMPMLLARSKSMFRRKKLENWIRICRRLNSISRHAHHYQRVRSKWVFFNRWLKYLAQERINPTPGLIAVIKRRALLHPDYDEVLKDKGFKKSVYHDSQRLRDSISDFVVLFARWKMWTQEEKMFRFMEQRAHELYILRLKQKVFWAIKTELNISECMVLINEAVPPFQMVRIQADLEQCLKKFFCFRRKSMAHTIRKYNKKFGKYMVDQAKGSVGFKQFMSNFHRECQVRISTEQRILSDAFDRRGQQQFDDHHVPLNPRNHPIMPPVMSRLEGKPFADPHMMNADGRAITIPAGFKISKIKIAHQVGRGIIGWQLYWTADGAKDVEGGRRGNWNAATTLSVQEFVIPKDDFIVGVEYMYEGAMTVAIRLKMFIGGMTRWIGGKTSVATLTVMLDVGDPNLVPKEDYELEREANLDPDERENPALPYNYIIGLTGMIHNSRATGIGLVVRKVRAQHLFSYCWVNDELNRIESDRTAEAQAKSSLAHSIDAKSIPSHLSTIYRRTVDGIDGDEAGGGGSRAGGAAGQAGLGPSASGVGARESLTMTADFGGMSEAASVATSVSDDSDDSDDWESESGTGSSTSKSKPKFNRDRRKGILAINAPLAQLTEEEEDGKLSSSETQFFDIIRMRTTELSHALLRVEDFSERLWKDKIIRVDPVLGKLVSTRIISALSRWYFNSLSKRLVSFSTTERPAMQLLRKAKSLHNQADSIRTKMTQLLMTAEVMESSVQPWTGKGMLHPLERAAKKEHNLKIKQLRSDAERQSHVIGSLRFQAIIAEKRGFSLLPRIPLSLYVVNNYRVKMAAARHKESLLERMTLEEIKNGLFGADRKEKLLSSEQMQAIHESLKSKNLQMRDTSSLDRMVDDVLKEEGAEMVRVAEERERTARGSRRFTRSPVISNSSNFYPPSHNEKRQSRSSLMSKRRGTTSTITSQQQQEEENNDLKNKHKKSRRKSMASNFQTVQENSKEDYAEGDAHDEDSTINDDDTLPSLVDALSLEGEAMSPWAADIRSLNTSRGLLPTGGVGMGGGISISSPKSGMRHTALRSSSSNVVVPSAPAVRASEFRPQFPPDSAAVAAGIKKSSEDGNRHPVHSLSRPGSRPGSRQRSSSMLNSPGPSRPGSRMNRSSSDLSYPLHMTDSPTDRLKSRELDLSPR